VRNPLLLTCLIAFARPLLSCLLVLYCKIHSYVRYSAWQESSLFSAISHCFNLCSGFHVVCFFFLLQAASQGGEDQHRVSEHGFIDSCFQGCSLLRA